MLVSRYANAMYQAICETGNNKIENDIDVLYKLTYNNKNLNRALCNFTKQDKIIKEITIDMHQIVQNFAKLLAKNHRLHLLNNITKKVLQLSKEKKGEIDVFIISTIPISKDDIKKVQQSFCTKKTINIINNVDKSILGGIIIKIGYRVLDLSSQYKLKMLQKISKKEVLKCN